MSFALVQVNVLLAVLLAETFVRVPNCTMQKIIIYYVVNSHP